MSKYYVKTLNKTGYALSEVLDEISTKYIEFSRNAQSPILEIGAAFGVVSLECVKVGATTIANDLDENHLKVIHEKCPRSERKKLILMPGDFEELKILEGSLSAILCCRVIHFFDPDKLMRSIRKAFSWLEIGGRAYFTVESPYLKNWNNLPVDFNERKKLGNKFPGYVRTRDYINEGEIADNLPEYMHFFDDEILANIFEACGFQIEECALFPRPYFFEEVQLDGRESVGIIAVKK
jgi:SAM-dependent methyltransferase